MEKLLRGDQIFTEVGVVENGYVLISDKNIKKIGLNDDDGTEEYEEIIIPDSYILPGFIDLHIHGFLDIDVTECNVSDLERLSFELSKHGVVGFLPSLISASSDVIIEQVNKIRSIVGTKDGGARILGVHLEGPWLHYERRGAHPQQWVRNPEKSEVKKIIRETKDIVKSVTFSPEIENAVWLTEVLSHAGIVPIMGHTNATYEQAQRVILAGARHVTHMFNAMLGFRENKNELGTIEPGIEAAIFNHDSVTVELIPSPTFVSYPLIELVWKLKGPDKFILVTDAGRGTGFPEGYVMEFQDGRKAAVRKDALRLIEDGPLHNALLGNIHTLNVGIKNLARHLNIPLYTALKTVSLNPARVLGLQKSHGSLMPGKRADIVVTDRELNILMTIIHGEIVYRSAKSKD